MGAWILFYDDGQIIRSEQCAPAQVPGRGLICGAQEDVRDHPGVSNVSWTTFAGDFYLFSEAEQLWWVTDLLGLHDQILSRKEVCPWFCEGRRVSDRDFWPIWQECRQWAKTHGLPEKSGFVGSERRPVAP